MHLDAAGIVLLAAAAFVAAAVNAVAGGGSLLSFPTLLLLGYTPLGANVTNIVGLISGYAATTAGYRRELSDQRRRLAVLGAISAAGALGGAVLLIRTPPAQFHAVVPWLILASCALLAAQPSLARALAGLRASRQEMRSAPLLTGTFLAAAYGGFFGAGLGVLILAVLGIFLGEDLQRLNALKGVLSLITNAVAAACFVILAPVAWPAVAVMLPAALLGGITGVALARRLSPTVLRVVVVALGVAIAVRLLV